MCSAMPGVGPDHSLRCRITGHPDLTFANPKRTETRGAGNWYQRPMGFSVSIGNRGIRGLRFRKTYSSTSTSHRDCGAPKGPCISHKILADHNPAQSTWFWLRRRKHRKQSRRSCLRSTSTKRRSLQLKRIQLVIPGSNPKPVITRPPEEHPIHNRWSIQHRTAARV